MLGLDELTNRVIVGSLPAGEGQAVATSSLRNHGIVVLTLEDLGGWL